MPDKQIYEKGKITTLNIDQGVPIFDLSTKAVKYAELQQIQDLFDVNIVTNNAKVFYADYMVTDAGANAGTMIPGASFTGTGSQHLETGNIVFRNASTDQANNGLWEIQGDAVSAVRYSKCIVSDDFLYSIIHIKYEVSKGLIYRSITDPITVGVTSIVYEQLFLATQAVNATSSPTFADITDSGLTISELIATDANKKLVSLAAATYPSLAEMQTLKTTGSPSFGTAKIGTNASNCTEVEADGTLKFNGTATVFKDVVIPFLYKGTGAEAVLVTFVGGIKNLQFDVGKLIYLENAEAPHDYMQGSEIELHLHWAVNAAMIAGDKVKWQLECSFANMINGTNTGTIFCDPATPNTFGTKIMTVEYTSPVGGTPAGSNIYSSFGTILAADMANVKIGAGFLGTITRIAKSAGGTDPASNSIFGLNIGIHYEVDTIGSRQRGIK